MSHYFTGLLQSFGEREMQAQQEILELVENG